MSLNTTAIFAELKYKLSSSPYVPIPKVFEVKQTFDAI